MSKFIIDFPDLELTTDEQVVQYREGWFKVHQMGSVAAQVERGARARVRVIGPDRELIDTFEVEGTKV